ncbi:MAG: ChaN family lipoprotein, partial [Burkholderiales bacterium]
MSLMHWLHTAFAGVTLLFASMAVFATPQSCLEPGQWSIPSDPKPRTVGPAEVAASARDVQYVLLGESHDQADHHRWQLHTLGMLLALRGSLVIGMEMFPREAQPVLDRWVAGELSEAELLR